MYLVFVAWVLVVILAVTGYVKNIIGLAECDFKEPYKAEVIRTVGIIPPVGIIVGWIDIEDK